MTKFITGIWLLLCSLAATAQTPADSIALANAPWQTVALKNGAESRCAQLDLFGSRQTLSVVSYPRKGFDTKIVHLDHKAQTTSQLGEAAQADFAVNGSYFNVKTFAPVTFVLIDGQVMGHTTPHELMRTNGIIAFRDKHGRKPHIAFCDTTEYPGIACRYRSALAAGPVLVHDGKIVAYDSKESFYTHRHPRALIGLTPGGEVVMVVIDGRFPGQAEGATIAESAYIARQLGLTDALNLDGGGSSTLWTAQQGVLNHPYDNHRFDHEGQRAVPNCIVVRTRK